MQGRPQGLPLILAVLAMDYSDFHPGLIYLHAVKQLLAVILLLSHINFSMFIAQVDEVDTFDRSGRQVADINSLAQFISYTFGGRHASDLKDGDDDNARYFHVEKQTNPLFAQEVIVLKKPSATDDAAMLYPEISSRHVINDTQEISTPPPELYIA